MNYKVVLQKSEEEYIRCVNALLLRECANRNLGRSAGSAGIRARSRATA